MASGTVPLKRGGNVFTIGQPAVVQLPARVFRVRLTGMLFDTDKTFMLPSALNSIRVLKKIWAAHKDVQAVIDGHADRAGSPGHNQKLSERRAEAIQSYLKDDVDGWLRFYGAGVPPTLAWGKVEDQHMLGRLGFATVSDYQTARGLTADGVAGSETRRSLVTDYMAEDGTRLPDTAVTVTHGCGESHPEVPTADGVAEQRNRRVEIFLFEQAIDPPPVNPCPQPCAEHDRWVGDSVETVDLGDDTAAVTVSVVDQDGAAVADSDIHLSGIVPEDAQTDAAGAARIVDVVPSHYEVFARKDGFASASVEIDVPAGGDVPVALTLRAANGGLTVLVRDDLGLPLAGATVAIDGPRATKASGVTAADGTAPFGAVPAGAYQIAIAAAGFTSAAETDTVQPDQSTTHVTTLVADPPLLVNGGIDAPVDTGVEVALLLRDLHRRPCANLEATVAAGTARAFGTTDASGALKVRVPEGTTQLVVSYAPPDAGGLVDWPLRLGLPGADTDEGAIGRLENLGYPAAKDRDYALFSFQVDEGIAVTGELDAATRAALATAHGS
jgi:outer membrane protein OmpA-like peptidoglycan-associated protein